MLEVTILPTPVQPCGDICALGWFLGRTSCTIAAVICNKTYDDRDRQNGCQVQNMPTIGRRRTRAECSDLRELLRTVLGIWLSCSDMYATVLIPVTWASLRATSNPRESR